MTKVRIRFLNKRLNEDTLYVEIPNVLIEEKLIITNGNTDFLLIKEEEEFIFQEQEQHRFQMMDLKKEATAYNMVKIDLSNHWNGIETKDTKLKRINKDGTVGN
jgi:hypothetical protein